MTRLLLTAAALLLATTAVPAQAVEQCALQYHRAQIQAGEPRAMRNVRYLARTAPNSPERYRLMAHLFMHTADGRAAIRDATRYCAARGQ
jgi:uncharacterized protein HemY